ncbi:MAG: EF-hand domain-containing protein [Rhodanobacteraceae bacterium]
MQHAKQLAIAAGAVLAGAALAPSAFAWNNSGGSTTQQHAQIKKMDTNNNDQVSRTEFDQYWTQQFQTADTNGDGKLSRQEARTAAQAMNGGRVTGQTRFDHMFRQADSNHDGSVSRSEDMAYHNKMFRQADSNNDGKLSVAEVGRALQNPDQSLASL